jgi:hypothetical protein
MRLNGIGDDVYATRKGSEQQANIGYLGTKAGADLTFGIRMQDQVDAKSYRRRLSRVVVRRVSDATEAENDVPSSQTSFQRCRNTRPFVAEVLDPGQAQTTTGQQFGYFRKMPVDAFSRQDLVTDDDRSETHMASFTVGSSPITVTTAPCRKPRSASRQ